MNLELLLEKYQNDPRILSIAENILLPQPAQHSLKNLHGSSPSFILSGVYRNELSTKLNHLVVLDSAEDAAYFHNTLENLIQPIDLFVCHPLPRFPCSYPALSRNTS